VSLIYFHRFLIFCAILFGAYFCWYLWVRYDSTGHSAELWASIGSGLITLALVAYLPTVKGRQARRP